MLHPNAARLAMSDTNSRSSHYGTQDTGSQRQGNSVQPRQLNLLLQLLPQQTLERLGSHLEPIRLMHGQVLWEPDEPIRSVYFPQTCVASVLVPLSEEAPVEAATIGWEGLVGMPVVLGAEST